MGLFGLIRWALELLGIIGREVHDAEQRKAGSDASQVKAMTDEEKRVIDASDAANGVSNSGPDPFNRDGK